VNKPEPSCFFDAKDGSETRKEESFGLKKGCEVFLFLFLCIFLHPVLAFFLEFNLFSMICNLELIQMSQFLDKKRCFSAKIVLTYS
jgi:nitrate reductase NapE component